MSGPGSATRVAALGLFEASRALRSRWTALGVLVFFVAHALGRWQHADDDGLFIAGYLVAFAISFAPGLATDRGLTFDLLLVYNLVSACDYALGKEVGMVAWTTAFTAACWGVAVALGGGDFRFATWYAASVGLVVLAALPFVVVADLLLTTRLPAAAVFIMLVVVLFALVAVGVEPATIQSWLGLRLTPHAYASLVPLLVRAGVGVAVTPALIVVALRLARRV